MRYFTADMLIRLNSRDQAVSDQASADWKSAFTAYRARLVELDADLSPSARRLASLRLHDAELIAIERATDPSTDMTRVPSAGLAVLSTHVRGEVTTLVYGLIADLRSSPPRNEFPFSGRRVDWLYDEVDVGPGRAGGFVHHILLSDGRELELSFAWAIAHSVRVPTSRVDG